MVSIQTSRFGALQVEEGRIITFADGLLGFPGIKRYMLMDYMDTPLKWLQAVDDPDVAFIVAAPNVLTDDGEIKIDKTVRRNIQLEKDEDLAVLVIVRVDGEDVIANVNGPLVINSKLMVGVQAVADRSN